MHKLVEETSAQKCFNRYMVECECLTSRKEFKCSLVLIDTWWNVNRDHPIAFSFDVYVLIDTWWNVNQFIIC